MREITQEEVDKLDVVSRIGTQLLGSACSASDVVYTSLTVAQKLGLRHVSIHLTYSDFEVAYRPPQSTSHVVVQTVSARRFDYGRQTRVKQLAAEIIAGRLDHIQAASDMDWIESYRGPYPVPLVFFSSGVMAAAAAFLFGGNATIFLVTFIAAFALDFLFDYCDRHLSLPVFFLQVLAGLIGIFAASICVVIDPYANASAVVIAVIIVMLAGMTSTAAVNDAITGWHLTGVGRLAEALVNTMGLVIGVRMGILLTNAVGLNLSISEAVRQMGFDSHAWRWLLACVLMGLSVAIYAQTPKRALIPIALLTPMIYLLYVGTQSLGMPMTWGAAVSATVSGFISIALSRWTTVTTDAFAVATIIPLMPGSLLYRALWAFSDDVASSASYGLAAVGTALALAAGLTFGQYVGVATAKRVGRTYAVISPVFQKPYASLRERRERAKQRHNGERTRRQLRPPRWLRKPPVRG